jgi:hypothetical protein
MFHNWQPVEMLDPWATWNEIASLAPSQVPQEQRPLYAIGWLRTEVNSDGFDGLFFNLGGETVPEVVKAARAEGRDDLAGIIERAMAVLGDTYPLDIHQRQRVMSDLSDVDRQVLRDLDEEYYDLEAAVDLDELMRVFAAWGS